MAKSLAESTCSTPVRVHSHTAVLMRPGKAQCRATGACVTGPSPWTQQLHISLSYAPRHRLIEQHMSAEFAQMFAYLDTGGGGSECPLPAPSYPVILSRG